MTASLFTIVLAVVSRLCSYYSTSSTRILGESLSTITSSTTTQNHVAYLNNEGLSLLSIGLANYTQAIAYFDKASK